MNLSRMPVKLSKPISGATDTAYSPLFYRIVGVSAEVKKPLSLPPGAKDSGFRDSDGALSRLQTHA